jgi:hypothetical protein
VYDVVKLPDKYYLYAVLPFQEGNYTLAIEDVRYEYENTVTDSPLASDFRINKSESPYLKINPGFVVAREDFYIEVESTHNKQVEAEFLGQSKTINLIQNKEEKIYFSVFNVTEYTEANISLNSYSIPVIIFPNKTDTLEYPKFRFNPLEVSSTILKGEKHSFTIALINFGLENITGVRLNVNSSDLQISINPSSVSNLERKSTNYINLTISSEQEGDFKGTLIAESSNLTAALPIKISVTENQSEIVINNNTSPGYVEEKGCGERGGSICANEEKCSVELVLTTDGFCCLGECVKEGSDDYSWIYGLILIIALIGGLIGFSYYMKKKQDKKQDPLKKREKSFNQRIQPAGAEVRGSLSKT